MQVIKDNFPQLSNMFLDNNEKLQTNAQSSQVDLVSSVSNTVGDNLDNLIRSIKLAHLELLKQGNMQIMEQLQTLINKLSEEAWSKGLSLAPVGQQSEQQESNARMCGRPKAIYQFVAKCIVHLQSPALKPAYPASAAAIEADLEKRRYYTQ